MVGNLSELPVWARRRLTSAENRVKELGDIETAHQKINGKIREENTNLIALNKVYLEELGKLYSSRRKKILHEIILYTMYVATVVGMVSVLFYFTM